MLIEYNGVCPLRRAVLNRLVANNTGSNPVRTTINTHMRQSKKELERAIIIVGDSLGIKEATEFLLVSVGVYSTIKELVYKLFVEGRQQYFETDDDVFESISLIREYCQEMGKKGKVEFDVPYQMGR